jgi:restriction system protein
MTSAIPKYDDFMLPTLQAIRELGGSASIEEIQDKVTERMGLSQGQLDLSYPKSGALVAPDRMSWARSHLKIAGLLASGGKGVWVLTDLGRDAAILSPAQVKEQVKKLSAAHHAMVMAKRAEARAIGNGEDEPAAEADAEWSELLLEQLRKMAPDAFERLAQRLLRESGFVKVEVSGKSGDGGIDGSGVLRMNLISFQVLFQCKRYKGSVASEVVRNFRGAMQGRADKGLIITTGTFTSEARKEATRDGAPAIDLIDGEALCELLREKRLGVRIEQVVSERISIVETFFEEI